MLRRYEPDELLNKYRDIRASITEEEFFCRPGHAKTRELWQAAHFGRAYERHFPDGCALHVSEIDEQTEIDFYFEVAGRLHRFQCTEVLEPHRRRGEWSRWWSWSFSDARAR